MPYVPTGRRSHCERTHNGREPPHAPAPTQHQRFAGNANTVMTSTFTVLAVADGSFIFLTFIVVMFFAVVHGFYTLRGSAINMHPNDGLDGAPGSAGPSEESGKGRSTGNTSDGHSVGDTFSTRGTESGRPDRRHRTR
jgi:hypothetical protein